MHPMHPFRCTTLALCLMAISAHANNIQVANINLIDNGGGMATVQFDISWENSWRGGGVNNWDAAWVFVKYKFPGGGLAYHANLSPTGHSAPVGVSIEPGLVDVDEAPSPTANPVVGVILYRSVDGTGTFQTNGVQLLWQYSDAGIPSINDIGELQVHAIEMAYINEGAYHLGSGGNEQDHFQRSVFDTAVPFHVTSSNAINIGPGVTALWTNEGTMTEGTLPTAFPNGFGAFYMMKYEISQQQYVDFLNGLNRSQQNARVGSDIAIGVTEVMMSYVMNQSNTIDRRQSIRCASTIDPNAPVSFFCDANGNGIGGEADDGQWVACNFLGLADVIAYLNWCGLRPMSEMEYEKACRGPIPPQPDEFPWRTATIASTTYTLSDASTTTESVATGYSTAAGNAAYQTTVNGSPVRVGVFSAHSSNTGRITAGASYYGVMDLAGGQYEITVSVENGRTFEAIHGNGELHPLTGQHYGPTELRWPGLGPSAGFGTRGGGTTTAEVRMLCTSDRTNADGITSARINALGGRGVRTAP